MASQCHLYTSFPTIDYILGGSVSFDPVKKELKWEVRKAYLLHLNFMFQTFSDYDS